MLEELVVGLRIIDLMPCPLRPGVNAGESDTCAELAVHVSAVLLHVRAWLGTDDVARIFALALHDEGVLQLPRIGGNGTALARRVVVVARLGRRFRFTCVVLRARRDVLRSSVDAVFVLRIDGGGEGGCGRGEMVLKEEVVLMRHPSNSAEDGALHEVVGVAAEAVDDVVVVPDVELRDLSVGHAEGVGVVPAHVVVEVVLIASRPHVFVEGELAALARVRNGRPWLERPVCTNRIIINLIPAANHDMEGLLLVHPQHVIPQTRPLPQIHVRADGEAVAGMEHDAEALLLGTDEEALGFIGDALVQPAGFDHVRDVVFPQRLRLLKRHLDLVVEEGFARVFVEFDGVEAALEFMLRALIAAHDAGAMHPQRLRALARRGHDEDAAVPYRIRGVLAAHATVVEEWPAENLEVVRRAQHLRASPNAFGLRLGRRVQLAIRRHSRASVCWICVDDEHWLSSTRCCSFFRRRGVRRIGWIYSR